MGNGINFVQNGESVDYRPSLAVAAGDVITQGSLLGIAKVPIAANDLGAMDLEGVYDGPKATGVGTAIAFGKAVYWDAINGVVTETGGLNRRIGTTVAAAADADTTVRFKLVGDARSNQLLFNQLVASTAISNTVAETAFDQSVTIPANQLKVGDSIRVRFAAIATAAHSTDTLNVKLKIGATVIVATGALDVAANDLVYIEALLTIRTIGAGGTLVASGIGYIGTPGTANTKPFLLASTAIDTTAVQAITATATWSVADPGNSVRSDMLVVERVG